MSQHSSPVTRVIDLIESVSVEAARKHNAPDTRRAVVSPAHYDAYHADPDGFKPTWYVVRAD